MADQTQDEFELEISELNGDCHWKVVSTADREVIIEGREAFDSKSDAVSNFELVQRAMLSL